MIDMTQSSGCVIRVHRAWGPSVTGPALVIHEGFSPRYDLDRWTGIISRPNHSAEGQSIAGKVLIFPSAKGGVAGGWAFLDLVKKDIAPTAFIFGVLNPVMVQGAVLAGLPIMEGWDEDAIGQVKTGDRLSIDPSKKQIALLT